ncbi:NrtR DNA-binding winged helix domain-containing protein [Rudaeicoccus suwonensis]|uniref:NrtR DNA-binding winged helix domain-containing protein n=1 Tax=Rudaeicoccus suwonensis TaxID=657409 RepID=A0A561EC92_9MICO|nr:NUDIX hydrolase [Rudaeicoccus suwonensis]TWE13207.1 hypothetical protein BKA23_2036 [Rudaeicoccus suwonensis]
MPKLEAFPRPAVAVDLALLTVDDPVSTPALRVFIRDLNGEHHLLPGGFIRERSTIAQTVDWILEQKVGLSLPRGVTPRLLRVFDAPDRDDRTWAMSIAHSICLPTGMTQRVAGDWVAPQEVGKLRFDHNNIVDAAVAELRERYEFRGRSEDLISPDPDGFFGSEAFTLHQLRRVHEAVVGMPMHKDNFAKRMTPLLDPVLHRDGTPVLAQNLRGRPAALYRRRA